MEKMSNKLGNVCRRITTGVFALLLSLDFKFVNNSKENTENVDMLNVPLRVSHN